MSGQHVDVGWTGVHEHFSVGVEIEGKVDGHHHQMKEIQHIAVEPKQIFEKTKIVIESPDSGLFVLAFQAQDLTQTKSGNIKASCTAAEMKSAISAFYQAKFKSEVDVERLMYDQAGVKVEDIANAKKLEYTITLKTLIKGESVASITVIPIDTTASISVVYPRNLQLSGAPLGGKVRVKCPHWNGQEDYT